MGVEIITKHLQTEEIYKVEDDQVCFFFDLDLTKIDGATNTVILGMLLGKGDMPVETVHSRRIEITSKLSLRGQYSEEEYKALKLPFDNVVYRED